MNSKTPLLQTKLPTVGTTAAELEESLTIGCAADRGALLVQEDMLVVDALALMRKEHQGTAIVLALGGGVLGLVTLAALEAQLATVVAYAASDGER